MGILLGMFVVQVGWYLGFAEHMVAIISSPDTQTAPQERTRRY